MATPVPVYLHARDPITRAGLVAELRSCRELTLVNVGADPPPRVAIVAAESPDEPTLTLMRGLRARDCSYTVLVINTLTDNDLLRVVEAGACAIVWRWEATGTWLARTAVKAASGEAMLPADILGRLLRQVSRLQQHVLQPHGIGLNGLSAREADVLRLAADGLDTDDIAAKLAYSRRTVTNIIRDITVRYHLRNRTHAVAYAIREGLI
jgi:DNA-binding NarL/FixJ family response regulator